MQNLNQGKVVDIKVVSNEDKSLLLESFLDFCD